MPRSNTVAGQYRRDPGFALIVTLMLMVLLVVLAIGMLSLSSIGQRTSMQGKNMVAARANARLAMMAALGELQRQAGPDTRVTGNANMYRDDSPNPYWVGVWKTRTSEALAAGTPGTYPVRNIASPLYLSDSRDGQRSPNAARWLVSSSNFTSGSSQGTKLDPTRTDNLVVLDTGRVETTVRVPKVTLPNKKDAIAWWVSDESQKARIDLADPHASSADRKAYSLAVAQDYEFEQYQPIAGGVKPLAGLATAGGDRRKDVVTIPTAGMLPVTNAAAFDKALQAESIHHLSTSSAGLFTDTKRSGLKQDLSAFLEVGNIAGDAARGLEGLQENDPIIPGTHHLKTSPKFGILKGWLDLAYKLDKDSGPATMEPQPPNVLFQNFKKDPGDNPRSVPGAIRDLTNVSKPAVEPVVVEASLGWDWSPYQNSLGTECLRGHVYPRVTLWNPFNVTLKATRYVVMLRHPYSGSFIVRDQGIVTSSGPFGWGFHFKDSCGSPTEGFLGFVTEATELLPGETKIFTPAVNLSSGAKLSDKAAMFNPTNFAANVLTANQIPGVENFFYDTNAVLPAETAANRNKSYGFPHDVGNNFYNDPRYDCSPGDEFLVLQETGDPSATIRWADVTEDKTPRRYPRVAHFLCQNWGLNRYFKWYSTEMSDHPSNNGTPFREFKEGAPDIGPLENRRPPRLWRRGVRMAWFDDNAEWVACGSGGVPKARITHPWISTSNIRGGMFHQQNWVAMGFAGGWQYPGADGHFYFQQPTDPQKLTSFFPPSPIAAPDGGFPSTCTIYDIPRRKSGILSLGQLQHAQLSYATWHPSFVIGNSQPTMYADLDATAIKQDSSNPAKLWVGEPTRWTGTKPWNFDPIIQKGTGANQQDNEVLLYDLSHEANEVLWDRFMISSIPYQGDPGARRPAWKLDDPLPVGRYAINDQSRRYDRATIESRLVADPSYPFHNAAAFLINKGAFNVNCASVEAWTALYSSLRGMARTSLDGKSSTGDNPISRSLLPALAGRPDILTPQDEAVWNAFRSLTDAEVRILAEKTVNEVRKRGPFLSLADFVNRRLTPMGGSGGNQGSINPDLAITSPELALNGTLDAAISKAKVINQAFASQGLTDLNPLDAGGVPTAVNRPVNICLGVPGFFTQGDLLTVLAPALTARGDTFTIRAVGESIAPNGSIIRARCEAVVQRRPDYVNQNDDPLVAAIQWTGTTPAKGKLSPESLQFGRRFEITSFRWLTTGDTIP